MFLSQPLQQQQQQQKLIQILSNCEISVIKKWALLWGASESTCVRDQVT